MSIPPRLCNNPVPHPSDARWCGRCGHPLSWHDDEEVRRGLDRAAREYDGEAETIWTCPNCGTAGTPYNEELKRLRAHNKWLRWQLDEALKMVKGLTRPIAESLADSVLSGKKP